MKLLADLKTCFPKTWFFKAEQKVRRASLEVSESECGSGGPDPLRGSAPQEVMAQAYEVIAHIYLKQLIRTSRWKLKLWSSAVGPKVSSDAEELRGTVSDLVGSEVPVRLSWFWPVWRFWPGFGFRLRAFSWVTWCCSAFRRFWRTKTWTRWSSSSPGVTQTAGGAGRSADMSRTLALFVLLMWRWASSCLQQRPGSGPGPAAMEGSLQVTGHGGPGGLTWRSQTHNRTQVVLRLLLLLMWPRNSRISVYDPAGLCSRTVLQKLTPLSFVQFF